MKWKEHGYWSLILNFIIYTMEIPTPILPNSYEEQMRKICKGTEFQVVHGHMILSGAMTMKVWVSYILTHGFYLF